MKKKIKLMMLFVLLFQIVQPVISGSYIYAQGVKESIEYEKGYEPGDKIGNPKGGVCSSITASEGYTGDQCEDSPIVFINPSFEEPTVTGSNGYNTLADSKVPGWTTSATDHMIEMWNQHGYDSLVEKKKVPDGNQIIEMNATQGASSYQDFDTVPGQKIYYSLQHGGRAGTENMDLKIGAPKSGAITDPKNPTEGGEADRVIRDTVTKGKWNRRTGVYTVPAGQTKSRIAFSSPDSGGMGNLLDDIRFNTKGVYDNEVNILGPSTPVDYNADEFRISNSIHWIQGDEFADSTITYTVNQDIEVNNAMMKLDEEAPVDIMADLTVDPAGDNETIITYNNIPHGKNMNVDIGVHNTKAPTTTNLGDDINYELEATSKFDFYSDVEHIEDPTASSYLVTDKNSENFTYNYNKITPTKTVTSTGSNPALAQLNDILHYNINLENTGTVKQTNVKVEDLLSDEDLQLNLPNITNFKVKKSGTELTQGTDYTLNTNDAVIKELLPAFTYSISFDIQVKKMDATPTIENTATVVSSDEFATLGDDSAATIDKNIDISGDPNVKLTKEVTGGTGDSGKAKPNDELTYTYIIENVENIAKANISLSELTLIDPLDDADLDNSKAPVLKSAQGNTIGAITPSGVTWSSKSGRY